MIRPRLSLFSFFLLIVFFLFCVHAATVTDSADQAVDNKHNIADEDECEHCKIHQDTSNNFRDGDLNDPEFEELYKRLYRNRENDVDADLNYLDDDFTSYFDDNFDDRTDI